MKVSDYIIDFLEKKGIKHFFGITGVSAVHFFDSISKNPNTEYVCPEHEQSAAMAADAYSRINKNFGVVISTSGPGATNLVTGVSCSYSDSIPVLVLTGQVPTSQLKRNSGVRQIGFQETDIVSMFGPITKYAKLIEDPYDVKYELEKAIHIAKSGRPGPVVLDIPDDLQRADIEISKLKEYSPVDLKFNEDLEEKINQLISFIKNSKRPVLILGGGIKSSNAEEKAKELIEKLNIPVLLTWAVKDLLPNNHKLLVGGFGVSTERTGNFAVQNSDLVISLGTRLDLHQTGTNISSFAKCAKKVILDIDIAELKKYEKNNMNPDLLIYSDVKRFIERFLTKEIPLMDTTFWMNKINEWKTKYPIVLPEYHEQTEKVNPYVFLDYLSNELKQDEIIIADTGANLIWTMQALKPKENQKIFSALNHSPMGYSLPASIGAYYAAKKPIVCLTGDGGIQMNIQELATIKGYNIPVKIFLFNNNGYGIIQQTQDTWLNSNYAASNPEGGVMMPDFVKISQAYGIPSITINNHNELHKIKTVLCSEGPILCNVLIKQHNKIIPKLDFGGSIEDPSPKLPRLELYENMIVNSTNES